MKKAATEIKKSQIPCSVPALSSVQFESCGFRHPKMHQTNVSALDNVNEICKLLKYSPRGDAILM